MPGAPAPRAEMSVGEVAARSGLSVSALHVEERRGLIISRRTAGDQRRYDRAVLRRPAVVRIAVRLGIPLAVLADALGPPASVVRIRTRTVGSLSPPRRPEASVPPFPRRPFRAGTTGARMVR